MQHPWPSTNHYRRTLENQSPTSCEPGTLRNTWFRRQRINDSRLKHKYLHLRRQKTTNKSNRHKRPQNTKIRTDDTQEPNKLRRRHKDPDDKHAKTAIRKTTHTQNRITPPKQEDLLRRNSREQIHQCYFIINMYKGHESAPVKNAQKNSQAAMRQEQ